MNHGQMVDDVRLAVNGRVPVHFFGKTGGDMPMYTLAEMTVEVNRLLEEYSECKISARNTARL